jgi:hypothetical protein
MRDDFSEADKRSLAMRVGGHCSNPTCRAQVFGPQLDSAKALNLGVAAHISAASSGGPRHDPSLTPAERASLDNGIWLCQNCAKLIDNDHARYSSHLLTAWKQAAEEDARRQIGRAVPSPAATINVKWCTLDYIEKAGIAATLRAGGYRLYWARAENVPEYVDLKGWEEVVWEDPRNGPVYLRVRDPLCEYVALLRKPEAGAPL